MNKPIQSLSEKVRTDIIAQLNDHLAQCMDLVMQAKQAHWNIKGPSFIALHQLFDRVYTETGTHADTLAERVVQLGGLAKGTLQAVASASKLPAYVLQPLPPQQHIETISNALAQFSAGLYGSIEQAATHKDWGTADLYTQVLRDVDKLHWFVSSHLK